MRIIPNRINWIRPGQSLALVSCGSMIKVAQTLEFFLNIHIFRTYCKNTPDHSTILCPANVEGLKRFQNHTILYSQTFRAASFHMLSLKPFYHFLTSLSGVPLTLPSISNLKPSRYFIPKQFRCILKLIWEHCD